MAYQPIRFAGSGLQFLNFPFGDTTYTKVFVGGLAWETNSETLHRYFEQFGDILEAVVITDKYTGRSKGYGFDSSRILEESNKNLQSSLTEWLDIQWVRIGEESCENRNPTRVTFRDPEAATRACADPNPVIDGRRANCNLASLGRPQPSLPYGRLRSPAPYFGSPQAPRVPYLGSPNYHQPVSYSYQPGFSYPHGYPAYGSEYVYPQGLYNPYVGQAQMYGLPGTVNTNVLPYGQMGHPPPGGIGYRSVQSFVMPGPHMVQYGRPSVSVPIAETIPTIQTPHFTGIVAPSLGQPRSMIPAPPREFTQNSGSDQTSG